MPPAFFGEREMIPLSDGRIQYRSSIPAERVRAYEEQERIRQAFQRKEPSLETLNYARFLTAFENDAKVIGGAFRPDDDQEILRRWPFLAEVNTPYPQRG